MDVVPVRLKNAVLRLLAHSKFRAHYAPTQQQVASAAAANLGSSGPPGTPPPVVTQSSAGTPRYSTPPKELQPSSSFGRLPGTAGAANSAAPEGTALSNAGNMFGLMVCGTSTTVHPSHLFCHHHDLITALLLPNSSAPQQG